VAQHIFLGVVPASADIEKIAYHFTADYLSESLESSDVISEFSNQVQDWQMAWEDDVVSPSLTVTKLTENQFLLLDSRGLSDTKEISFLTRQQACVALAGSSETTAEVEWALAHKLAVELDLTIVPLATAEPELIREFETK